MENLAAPRTFDMFVFSDRCAGPGPVRLAPYQDHNYNTVGGSILAQGDAGGSPAGVISVGAANWQTPDTLEGFSSQGPTLDGRLKPDVTGIDGVSVTGAGNFGSPPSGTFPQTFYGTSAAAPHGAGVAALLLQAAPCLLDGSPGAALASATARVDLRNLVLNNAVDLGTPGPDNAYGYGRIDALAAANATLPAAVAGPDQTVNGTVPGGASVALNGSGSSEPLGCPLALHWAGTCATATGASPTVTCPLGTNTETLTVTDNGVILSPESNVQITVTRFAINPTPSGATVSRGRAATYALSIAPQYGAFTNAVSLACSNLPAGTACSFSPRSVTPGSAGATSMLTLSTTAPAAVFNVPFGLPPAYGLGIAFMTLCLLSLMGLQRPARGRLATLGLAAGLFIFILTLQVACGAGSTAPTNPGTSAGTYTVIVTELPVRSRTPCLLRLPCSRKPAPQSCARQRMALPPFREQRPIPPQPITQNS